MTNPTSTGIVDEGKYQSVHGGGIKNKLEMANQNMELNSLHGRFTDQKAPERGRNCMDIFRGIVRGGHHDMGTDQSSSRS